MKLCPVCETENELGAKNCELCGEPLPIPTQPLSEPVVAPPRRDTTVAPAVVAIVDPMSFIADDDNAAVVVDIGGDTQPDLSPVPPPPTNVGVSRGGFSYDEDADDSSPTPAPTPVVEAAPIAEVVAEEITADPEPTPLAAEAGPGVSDVDEEDPFAGLDDEDGPPTIPEIPSPFRPPAEAASQPSEDDLEARLAALKAELSDAPPPSQETASAPTAPQVATAPASPTSRPAALPSAPSRAFLTVYQNRQPAHTHEVVNDETLIGRADPTSGAMPDLDLTSYDAGLDTSRRHAFLFREGGKFFLQPISNAGTQLGQKILEIGERVELKGGEVIVLAGKVPMKFGVEVPAPPERKARLVVYQNRQPVHTHEVVNDETLIGRVDPTSGAMPDLDLTSYDAGLDTSRRHAFLFREGGKFFLQPISNAGTQLGQTLLEIGERVELKGGEVIVLASKVPMKFELDG